MVSSFVNSARFRLYFLLSLVLVGGLIRFIQLSSSPFFSDQDWYYTQAVTSVLEGKFPLVGITTSIHWLHQGSLWSLLLIPGLVMSNYHPLSGSFLTIVFGLASIPLAYFLGASVVSRKLGLILATLISLTGFSVIHSGLSYHTSPIPLFILVFCLSLVKQKHLLAGLFLGFLYQLHLLTFIFWPLTLIYLLKRNIPAGKIILGFLLGILPFIYYGPVQTLGIFFWLIKFVIGLSPSSGMSVSYQVVLFIPLIIVVSFLLLKLKLSLALPLITLGIVYSYFVVTPLSPSLKEELAQINCSNPASTYLYWWKCEHN